MGTDEAAPARILIVDDEIANMQALCDVLGDQGYVTQGARNGAEALEALRQGEFDVLLTDLAMPNMDGVALLAAARALDPDLAGILMTGNGTIETAVSAMKAGAVDYVQKPVRLAAIQPVLARALALRRLRRENLALRDTVAIHELNEAIAHTLDPEVLLGKIADAALAQFEADEVSVMLLTEDGSTLQVAVVRGADRDGLLGLRIPVGSGIAGRVAALREPVVLEGAATDGVLVTARPRTDIRSALCMPMITRGKLVGVLNVNVTRHAGRFSLGQINVLGIFTNAAAAGIEAARLYESQRRSDARYRQVLDMAADAIISFDAQRQVIIFNGAAERIFGWTAAEVLGQPLDLFLPERLLKVHHARIAAFDALPDNGAPMQGRGPFPARRKDGTEFPAEISIAAAIEDGQSVYSAILRDVTQRVRQEEKIARLSRIRAVLSGINSAIVRVREADGLFREVCRIAVDAGGFRMAWIGLADPTGDALRAVTWMGEEAGYFDALARPDPEGATGESIGLRALRARRPVVHNDVGHDPEVAHRAAALARGYRSLAVLPLLSGGAAAGVIGFCAGEAGLFDQDEMKLLAELAGDISFALEVMGKEDRLLYLAHHEPVTGLPNRALLLERLEERVRMRPHDGRQFGVVLLDLRHFRNINQTWGRNVGDEVLRDVARRLGGVIDAEGMLAHAGTDYFCVVSRWVTDATEVARLVEALLDAIEREPVVLAQEELRLVARAGIALFPSDDADAETLYRNAEAALRAAKNGTQRYQFYAPTMNAAVAHTLMLESRMRGALERGEFRLYYQPKVDLHSGCVVGLEALLRWLDPQRGLVPPDQFIGLSEETGLIVPIGDWALREAVRTGLAWRKRGVAPVRIAVNVSAVQLRRDDFVDTVAQAIEGIGGEQFLDLEITESLLMDDIEATVRKLRQLRAMGVELAIDDFGTGYSSLAYLARLPVSVIKIDRVFIRELGHDPDHTAIVQSILSLTHSLGRKVVAEGVETEEQATLLRALRCNQYQGYLCSKPLPADDIVHLLARPVCVQ